MPELPDLTVFAESLEQVVLNRKIWDAEYHRTSRLNVDPAVLRDALRNQQVTDVHRVGKGLQFTLESGDTVFVHLMLSGGFKLCRQHEKVAFPILTITFDDGAELVLFDPKGLAMVALNAKTERTAVDALEITASQLKQILQKKPKLTVKECLIDQKLIAGIGNAYSDEILWHAKIAPRSVAGKLPDEAIDSLAAAIPRVLKEATEYLRQTGPGMMAGEIRDHLAVHQPKARRSPTGAAIMTEMVASKKTYYTDEQILYQ